MRSVLLLIAASLCSLPAFARFGISPLHDVVTRSAAIVDAAIQSGKVAGYAYRDHSAHCGFVYEARITESFKGTLAGTFTFASNVAMAPGSRHLLFLRQYDGDFPSDVHVFLEDEDDPEFGTAVERAKAACIAALPQLKSNYLHHGEFTTSEDLRRVLVRPSYWIGLGPELPAETLRDARAVPWEPLRAWLRKIDDLPDTSDWASWCDDSCLNGRLEATSDTMRRNLEALRKTLRTEADRAALDASQHGWENFTGSACQALVIQSQTSGLAESVALDCRLTHTFAHAGELWLLRHSPAYRPLSAHDPCDTGCGNDELGEMERDLMALVADQRNRLAADPTALTQLEAASRSWQAYAQDHCTLAADAISSEAARPQTHAACRRRMMDEHMRLSAWQPEFALDETRRRLAEPGERPSGSPQDP